MPRFLNKYLWCLFTFLAWQSFAKAQDCGLQVSLLTVSPGEELYSSFGHSALRVYDSASQRDLVYNYGTFNFEEPNFYLKFVQGKLNYFVSVEEFQFFTYAMRMENRSIIEQILDLSCQQKKALISYLQWNLMPENMYYKYDFTFDNCTSRLRDVAEKSITDSISFKPITDENLTFRNAIHGYLAEGQKPWSKLGIDILLGSRLDRVMTPEEAMFLPDNLMYAFDSAQLNGHPLVKEKEEILRAQYVYQRHNHITNPLFIFSCLFVIVAFLSFSTNTRMQKILASFDGVIFFLNGLLGILLLFMWFGTDHFMTKDNYNLLWACPTNIVAAFFVHSRRRWPRIYFIAFALAQILLFGFWYFLPQQMNIGLIPIIGIMIFRCFLYNPLNKRMDARNKISK